MTESAIHADRGEHQHGHGGHEHEEEPEQLREALKERLIELSGLSVELKALVAMSALFLAFLAVMAVVRNEQLGTLVTNDLFSEDGTEPASMSQLLFVASVVFVSFGWALIVTAATRAGWVARVATLAALGLAFGTERISVTGLNLGATVLVTSLLAVIAAIVILTWFFERDVSHHADPTLVNANRSWRVLRRLVLPFSFLVFLAIYGYIWHESNALGVSDNFPSGVEDQLSNVQWLLIPMLTLAGADFGDWGNFAAARCLRRIRLWSSDMVAVGVALVVAVAVVLDGLRIAHSADGAGIINELVMAGIVAAVAALVILVAEPGGGWPSKYPFALLAAVVTIDALTSFILYENVGNDPTGAKYNGYDALIWLGLGAAGLIVMIAMRRRGPDWLTTAAILASLVGVVYTMTSLDSVSSLIGVFGWNYDSAPWLGYEGLKAGAGIITVAVIAVAAVTKRIRAWVEPIGMLVSMTVSIQVLAWLDSAYGGAMRKSGVASAGGQLALFAAAVMVVALSWEFATSGESITNGHRRRFPRDSRVMAFLGYVLVTATVSVFFSSIGKLEDGHWKLIESQFEAESYVQSGLLFVGVPLVILIFILRFNHWRQAQTQAVPEEAHTPVGSASR